LQFYRNRILLMGKLLGQDEYAGLKPSRSRRIGLNQPEPDLAGLGGWASGPTEAMSVLRRRNPPSTEDTSQFTRPRETVARPAQNEAATTENWKPGPAAQVHTQIAAPGAELLPAEEPAKGARAWARRRGHALTTVLLFFFTLLVYSRPADWWSQDWPLFSIMESLTYYVGLTTLALFLPLQLLTDGSLTARPREFYYVLLLLLAGLLSIPLADQDRFTAQDTFKEMFVRAILIFIVLINAVRTERRWRFLAAVNWCVGVFLAYKAFETYVSGTALVEGYRVEGVLGGMFGNPNDLSQHLVTMTPLAVAFFFAAPRALSELRQGSKPASAGLITPLILIAPRLLRRSFYAVCAIILLLGTMVTFSRSGFLATFASSLVLTYKLGRKHRKVLLPAVLFIAIGALAAAPGEYRNRVLSILDSDMEAIGGKGSAEARKGLLGESVKVALRHPVLGIGMGNFRLIYDFQTHNAYTQVAAEMGLMGLMAYLFFIIAPIKRLHEIEKATYGTPDQRRFYYLAVGLQASLVAYMVGSFFGSIAYYYHIYYLVGFAVSFRLIYYNARGLAVNTLRLPEAEAEKVSPGGSNRPVFAGA
jgi:O-antigen ligase